MNDIETQQSASQVAKRARQQPASGTDSWCTPKWLADELGWFDLDPCSNARSHIICGGACGIDGAKDYRAKDGLKFSWGSARVFCNPPYSDVGPWARKLVAHEGSWVALLKLDPTTKWWATLMSVAPVVAPFRKRIRFESGTDGDMTANFPSVLVYSAWAPPRALRPHLWLPTWEVTP